MNIEELKKIVRGNGFQESHGSTTIVIDVETVVDLLDELKQCDIPVVSQQRELLIGFLDWQGQNKYNGDTDEEIVDWYLKHKDN
tara:strand:- start:32546 stop:32797 length:252 start_codon:yes stop_codon:yes gene_type:complete